MDLAGDSVRHLAIDAELHAGLPAFEPRPQLRIASRLLCQSRGEGLRIDARDLIGANCPKILPLDPIPPPHKILQLLPELRAGCTKRTFRKASKRSEEKRPKRIDLTSL